jgi:hypothetical protein
VSIPPHRLRPIEDPNTAILVLLHRIIAISQRPPGPPSARRAALDAFKRSLFSAGSAADLKIEMRKLIQGAYPRVAWACFVFRLRSRNYGTPRLLTSAQAAAHQSSA